MALTEQIKTRSLKKNRVIARLDIKGPNLIKGVSVEGLRVIGSPIDYAEKYYLNVSIIRLFSVYGIGLEKQILWDAYHKIDIANKEVTFFGTGNETRDFTFVENTVDLLCISAFSEYRAGEVFNGGTGAVQKVSDIAKMIITLTGSKSSISFTGPRSWDHVSDRRSDISKSKEALGYSPVVDIESQLLVTCEWMRSEFQGQK